MNVRLADIVRAFGVEPDRIRLIRRRYNAHWAVRAGDRRYVLRRFGGWKDAPADSAWELALVARLAAAGLPVAAPIGGPRVFDGAVHILMPFLPGRALVAYGAGQVDDAAYRQLGCWLAEFHLATAALPVPEQRPGFPDNVGGALPPVGGAERRRELLHALAGENAAMAARFAAAAEALEARGLPQVFAAAPRRVVHADFSPWNVRRRGRRLVGLLDFELSHVDVRAADVAAARRGYHDAVADGYAEVSPLTPAELAALDGLWLGGILANLWRVLEDRRAEGSELAYGLDWALDQLDKTWPYRP